MQEEIWKDIKGFEGLYQVSNLGRFASFYNMGNHKPDGIRRIKPLHKRLNGYYVVILSRDGIVKYEYIHRLVAETFCNKRNGCNEVDHIDCNKDNNVASNLRWVTSKENKNNPKTTEQRFKFAKERGTTIDQYTLDGEYISTYFSIREIARKYPNIARGRVRMCADGKLKSVSGYIWKYANK